MRILIVEDEVIVAEAIAALLQPLRDAFPGSEIRIVTSVEKGLEVAMHVPHPDIILLDLKFPGWDMDATISSLPMFERESGVIIITGTPVEHVASRFPNVTAEILWKPDITRNPGVLFRAIARTFKAFTKGKPEGYDQQKERIAKLEALIYGPEKQ